MKSLRKQICHENTSRVNKDLGARRWANFWRTCWWLSIVPSPVISTWFRWSIFRWLGCTTFSMLFAVRAWRC
jgi:hypothetical protein